MALGGMDYLNILGVPVVKGGQNLPTLVGIGLTDLKNIGPWLQVVIINTMENNVHHID